MSKDSLLASFLSTLCGFILIGCVGCVGSAPEAPPEETPTESAEQFFQVFVNSPGRADHDRHIGYLGDAQLRYANEDLTLIRVYDNDFHAVGFYLANGATYRLTDGEDEFLGNHDQSGSVRRLLETQGPFRITRGL